MLEETFPVAAGGTRGTPTLWCPTRGKSAQPQLTPGLIENAFEKIPLPASPLSIQPSGGRTIVNFPTIAYTTAPAALTRSVTLLGHHITFHIHPTTYTWDWGDGATTTTSTPGAPYDKHDPGLAENITHKYERKSTYRPRLDTTYAATYAVDGHGSRRVPGTVTIPGTPQALRADTYTPVLVAH